MPMVVFALSPLEHLVVGLLSVVLVVWPFWRIFSRAGYPGWLSLGMLVPLVNVVLLFVLAYADWPVFRRAAPPTEGGVLPAPGSPATAGTRICSHCGRAVDAAFCPYCNRPTAVAGGPSGGEVRGRES
jgi:hypothetical protein